MHLPVEVKGVKVEWAELNSGWGLNGFRAIIAFWNVALKRRNTQKINRMSLANLSVSSFFLLQVFVMLSNLFFVVFSYGRVLRWAYCHSGVICSTFVPNLAISLFLTLTSGTPGSLITVAVGQVRVTIPPGARASHKQRRSILDLLVTLLANFSFKDFSVRWIGLVCFGCKMNRNSDLFLLPLQRRRASTWACVMASLIVMSLLYAESHPLSSG